jgi:hypothetical protein
LDRFLALKGIGHVLESSKKEIIDRWAHSRNSSEIIVKHDLRIDSFSKELGEEFFD